ncbi:acyl carrier protein [Actinokineospora sp.]|uniref:acyl carrier protein n=1 Tax=Actinokineospora sp. TaxID=1872133 RepID=UPI004037D2FD
MTDPVRTFITQTVRDVMNLPVDEAGLSDSTLLGPGGLDFESLAFAELAVHAEREFGMQIPDEDFEQIVQFTVGQLAGYLEARLAGAEAG